MLARWNAAETYNEVEKLKKVLRWDKKELGLFIRAHSAHTEHVSLCDEEKYVKDPVYRWGARKVTQNSARILTAQAEAN